MTAEGVVSWNGDRILYQDIEFDRMDFQGFIHGMVNRAWRMLADELFLFQDEDEQHRLLPAIPWEHLRDNAAQESPKWSFLSDHRNKWPVNGATWMHDQIWSRQ